MAITFANGNDYLKWIQFTVDQWTILVLVFWLLSLMVNFCVDTKNKDIYNIAWLLDFGNMLSEL